MDVNSDAFLESLIAKVRPHEELWNKRLKKFKYTKRKSLLWDDIAFALHIDKEEVMKIWKATRKAFDTEFQLERKSRSGDGADSAYVSEWPLYENLLFLKESLEPAKTTGNLTPLLQQKKLEQSQTNLREDPPLPSTSSANSQSESSPRLESIVDISLNDDNELHIDDNVDILSVYTPKVCVPKPTASKNMDTTNCKSKVDTDRVFFQTLLPKVKCIQESDMLNFRKAITSVVQRYAYPKPKESPRQRKKRSLPISLPDNKENLDMRVAKLKRQMSELQNYLPATVPTMGNRMYRQLPYVQLGQAPLVQLPHVQVGQASLGQLPYLQRGQAPLGQLPYLQQGQALLGQQPHVQGQAPLGQQPHVQQGQAPQLRLSQPAQQPQTQQHSPSLIRIKTENPDSQWPQSQQQQVAQPQTAYDQPQQIPLNQQQQVAQPQTTYGQPQQIPLNQQQQVAQPQTTYGQPQVVPLSQQQQQQVGQSRQPEQVQQNQTANGQQDQVPHGQHGQPPQAQSSQTPPLQQSHVAQVPNGQNFS